MKSYSRLLIIGFISVIFTSCQTYDVSLTYNPASVGQRINKASPVIKIGSINDVSKLRGAEIGKIRNEFGIPIKSINAKRPISEITKTAFTHALQSRTLLMKTVQSMYSTQTYWNSNALSTRHRMRSAGSAFMSITPNQAG